MHAECHISEEKCYFKCFGHFYWSKGLAMNLLLTGLQTTEHGFIIYKNITHTYPERIYVKTYNDDCAG